MNGAESLLRTLAACGVEVCFANPGTSEMHFVAALDNVPAMRAILALQENVATGAADGYARMTGKPACTLLHLGPGLANGLSNLHNARKAQSPIVNIVGEHAAAHLRYDAPLSSDLKGIARTVSDWTHCSSSSLEAGADGARAVQASLDPPGRIATLLLPADTAWNEAEGPASPLPGPCPAQVSGEALSRVEDLLKRSGRSAFLLRGAALRERGLIAAGRIAARTGARLLCDTFAPRIRRGAGIVLVERIPYLAEQVEQFLEGMELIILVGAKPPVSFFAYPGKASWLTPRGCRLSVLAHPGEDGVADESITAGLPNYHLTAGAPPHDFLSLTGGSIGGMMSVATGAAVACPDRKVINLEADGSGMYNVQALWTQAREELDVLTIIFSNRAYAILNFELARVGAAGGRAASSLFSLSRPDIGWVKLAEGLGVPATRAETRREFERSLHEAMAGRGPRLIEAVI